MFDDLLAKLGSQDTVTHIGPSVLYERFRYYRRTVAQVVIAEPDPSRAALNIREIQPNDRIKLIESAVLANGRRAELRRYNFESLTSLGEGSDLKILFPGLRETGSIAVDVLPIAQLVTKLPQNHRGLDLLVIDSLGEELDILTAINAEGALERFSNIVLRIARLPASNGASPIKSLLEWLAAHHYDRSVVLDGSDPDLPVLYFQRNPLGEDLEQQTSLAASFRAENETRGAALAEAGAKIKKADEDLRVALRLQSAAHDDLKDLQRQHAELRADKQGQDELLRKVTQKLAYASDYLRRLAIDAPEAAGLVENVRSGMDDEFPDARQSDYSEHDDATDVATDDIFDEDESP